MRFIIIHGSVGHPEENWFPWLKRELLKLGNEVEVPLFPTPEGQNLKEWTKVLDKYSVDKDTVLVGHSVAVAFILKYLEKHEAKAAFLVSGFTKLEGCEYDDMCLPFTEQGFNWDTIKKNCRAFHVFNSDNDPYVPLEEGAKLSENLRCELNIVKDAGHINEAAGYTEFPLLLEKIQFLPS